MALLEQEFIKFRNDLLKASLEMKSNKLEYSTEWFFDLPGHDLKMNGVSIIVRYEIPTGWNGFGQDDLNKLEKEGFLIKVTETIDENDPLEKSIEYEILKAV
jgi:hypothetical protein